VVSTLIRDRQTSNSSASHSKNAGSGWRKVIRAATSKVLMMPPKKMGSDPNSPPISATRISAGTSPPGLTSHWVTCQRGRL